MNKIRCIVIPADINVEVGHMEFYEGDLSAMQGIVGGLYQAIDLEAQKATLWVNEEGKNIGLPKNQRATMELWLSDGRWRFQDFVAGNAFITGQPDEEGRTTSVPQEIIDLLFKTDEYKYEVQTGSPSWNGNGLRYDDYWDAAHGVLELSSRWMLVTECRVVAA
ncbi:DUF3846 domain-containing protein [Rhodococcus sp. IEGM 1351]|uniref:DUF3846 domain-containing protein n=1 Tax=Rhodococcus sp. IEGM 1351 TaxID=3047089 RepID=UPI0024B74E24|nr:DUF3846 domain-containing protein [Rhodococcus sp. IEGM 1351]MDI9934743.1 DUF3846 domain-containing protein [Rhodococcus sp. IEGM 1351]